MRNLFSFLLLDICALGELLVLRVQLTIVIDLLHYTLVLRKSSTLVNDEHVQGMQENSQASLPSTTRGGGLSIIAISYIARAPLGGSPPYICS